MDDVTTLLLRAAGGDREALGAFVRTTQGDVWRLCAHLTDRSAADDLAQETYLRALASLGRFRGESSGRTWLLAIARHVCIDHLRRRQRARRGLAQLPVVERVRDQSGASAVQLLIAGLNPDRRTALVLTQVIGLTYAEAAAVCGVPVGTIRSRVARARDELVAQMTDEQDATSGG